MSESGQRSRVLRALRPLHAIPVENRVLPGTPDVNYIGGWIELKWLRAWPRGEGTTVRLPHFNQQQRNWLNRRHALGGDAWMLLQVKKEWLLFTGRDAREYVGRLTRDGLYRVARMRWTSGLIDKELQECLTRNWDNWNGSLLVSGCS